jgi:hypothetical protein
LATLDSTIKYKSYLENEKDPIPWKVAFNGIGFIGK